MDDDLLTVFRAALGPGPIVAATGRALLDRYAEPHRAYHDRQHLREVLSALRLLQPAGELPLALVCAAFWHDAVYDPTATDNEQRSAELAAISLRGLGEVPVSVEEVHRLVLLTLSHQPGRGDTDGALLCDADLAVLAAPPDRYAAYTAGIRREYGHLGDEAFRAGRSAVLRRLLDRPLLFTTAAGRTLWDAAARRNVQGELAELSAPGGAAQRP